MKRIDLLLLLGLLILVGCDSKANQEADVIEHYQYSITITDSNWSEYESSELDEMLAIPDETLQKMTTNALVQAILEHPKLCELSFYDHDGNGFDAGDIKFYHLENYYTPIRELLQREDGEEAVRTFGIELLNDHAKKNLSELDADSMEYLQLYAINVNFPKMISALYPDIQLIRTPEDVLQPGVFSIKEQNAAYTYEELMELPGDQLVKVFVENGLEIDDEFKEVFTEEEFQDYFKGEFDFLRKGVTLRGHTMYFDLAGKTEVIYEKNTGEEQRKN